MKNKTIIDIWNEVSEEEKIDKEAFEFLASQVDIDNFHQKMSEISGAEKRSNKKQAQLQVSDFLNKSR